MQRDGTTAEHWDGAYRRDRFTLSWYEREPTTSLELIDELGVKPEQSVVDIGGGTSSLTGRLLDRGFQQLTVLDVSTGALTAAKAQLGDRAARVGWLAQDIRSWRPERRFDLWHDRAVFHFLVDPEDQRRYLETLTASLAPGGGVILATFALDGPDRCSGLPVARYDATTIATIFASTLQLVRERREERTTPNGTDQPFTWTAFRARL